MTTTALPGLLSGLSSEHAEQVMALGSRLNLAPGAVLFRLGDSADSLFLIERGRISLTLPMQVAGREEDIQIEERLPGETVGWSAIIEPHRFTLKATASLQTTVIAFSRAALLEHFATRFDVGYTVIRNVAAVIGQRLQVTQAMWLREMQRVVESRLA
jgi:CRP-like cAMP-binding protein